MSDLSFGLMVKSPVNSTFLRGGFKRVSGTGAYNIPSKTCGPNPRRLMVKLVNRAWVGLRCCQF